MSAGIPPPPVFADAAASPSRLPRWLVLATLVVFGFVLWVVHRVPPNGEVFYPRCGLFTLTGLYCPGCGSTRAVHHLTHGRVLAALQANALLTLSVPGCVCWLGWWAIRREAALAWLSRSFRWLPLALVVVALFGLLRNIPSPPFNWLTP